MEVRHVQDRGIPELATVLIIGEAPGRQEVQQGLPFVGPSGQLLSEWYKAAGFESRSLYFTNVLNFMPQATGGSLEEALKVGTVTQAQIAAGLSRARDLADSLPNLKVIVPCGNYAVSGFTRWGKVKWDPKRVGITSARGSICGYDVTRDDEKVTVKVVPTLHPAFVLRDPTFEKRALADWRRIAQECKTPELNLPERVHNITPDLNDLRDFYETLNSHTVLSVDIETWGNKLQCVGFATSAAESLIVPTTKQYWGSLISDDIPLEWIRRICEHPCDKVMQNGLFDAWWLQEYDIDISSYHWDTLGMHHCLDPLDSHSLEYMASIFTREPYWKDEAKSADAIMKQAERIGMQRLYVYNGLDVCVTFEIFERLHDLLRGKGRLKFYLEHYANMHEPLLALMRGGVAVDVALMEETRTKLLVDWIENRDRAARRVGKPLFTFDSTKCERDMLAAYHDDGLTTLDAISPVLVEKGHTLAQITAKWLAMQKRGISDAMLVDTMHSEYGLSGGKRTPTGRIQVNNIQLKKIQQQVEGRLRAPKGFEIEPWKETLLGLVDDTLNCRRSMKLSSFLNPARIDTDGRLRCTYKFTTKTGRLSSATNPRGTGTNLQNFDSTLHHVFRPRPGNIMLEIDLSQAESRVVNVLTGDEELIDIAHRPPHEYDEHTVNAMMIFDIPEYKVTKKLRDVGKTTNHATKYGLQGKTLSEALERNGYIYTVDECQNLINRVHERFPAIHEWHSKIRKTVLRSRDLYTTWGRHIDFTDIRLDDEVYRFAYSAMPQSEIGDLLNQWGLIPLHKEIKWARMESEIVLQVHDSLVADCPVEEVYDMMVIAEASLARERTYGACLGLEQPLSIPCGFAVGPVWTKAHEWKVLPSRDEVLEVCHQLVSVPADFEVLA